MKKGIVWLLLLVLVCSPVLPTALAAEQQNAEVLIIGDNKPTGDFNFLNTDSESFRKQIWNV